jgi:hypothetical protein
MVMCHVTWIIVLVIPGPPKGPDGSIRSAGERREQLVLDVALEQLVGPGLWVAQDRVAER